ncbi:hypothetical protein HZS_6461 [Henneguya salminicola]|nr:hypothetical protein HZS_6461 [Henneguya salminicola]
MQRKLFNLLAGFDKIANCIYLLKKIFVVKTRFKRITSAQFGVFNKRAKFYNNCINAVFPRILNKFRKEPIFYRNFFYPDISLRCNFALCAKGECVNHICESCPQPRAMLITNI